MELTMMIRRPRYNRNARPRPEVIKGQQQSQDSDLNTSLLYLEQMPNLTHGLTPNRLRRILADADAGNIAEQHALFADMEDRCDHLAAEMGKRKRALLPLEWDVIPASKDAKARDVAAKVREFVDMLPSVEDMLTDMADAIGHGFAALEIQWDYSEGLHIPAALTFRPQSWFQTLVADRNALRLRDGSADGVELWPCGWLVHTHKSKSGWLPRAGLFRVLAWTYLIRAYAASSEIQYVQIHGLPLRLGKYPPGSSKEDKSALLNALRCLGQDAAGIIPSGMEVLFESPSATVRNIPGELVTRCEQGMSKAILGGTLTSQADGKTSTNALGIIHNEVRRDILAADARQLASTLSEQLLRPLALLNLGVTERALLPYWQFDTQEAADLQLYADALPKLAPYMRISRQFVHERLKLPQASGQNDVFQAAVAVPEGGDGDARGKTDKAARDGGQPRNGSAAATALAASGSPSPAGRGGGRQSAEDTAQASLDRMGADAALADAAEALLAPLMTELEAGLTPAELQARLGELYPQMDEAQLADVLARAMFVAEVWGRTHG